MGADIVYSCLLDDRVWHYSTHANLLYFGNCFFCFELDKRKLSWRVLGAIFAVWNTRLFRSLISFAYLDKQFVFLTLPSIASVLKKINYK